MREDDPDEPIDYEYRHVERLAHVYLMPVLLGIGLVGQLINLATLAQARIRSVSVSLVYLRALSAVQLVSIVTLVPFCVRIAQRHRWHCRPCAMYHARLELPLANARFALGARGTKRLLSCVFLLSLLLYAPAMWQKDIVLLNADNKDGSMNETEPVVYKLTRNKEYYSSQAIKLYLPFRETVTRIIPIVSVVAFNVLLMFSFRRVARTHRRLTGTSAALLSNNNQGGLQQGREHSGQQGVQGAPQGGGAEFRVENCLQMDGSGACGANPKGRHSLQLPLSPLRTPRRPRSHSADECSVSRSQWGGGNSSSRPASRQSLRSWTAGTSVYDSEQRVYALIAAAACIFVLCNLPAALLSMAVTNTERTSVTYQRVRAACNLLEVASYTCNFYIYCVCSREYRVALAHLAVSCSSAVRRLCNAAACRQSGSRARVESRVVGQRRGAHNPGSLDHVMSPQSAHLLSVQGHNFVTRKMPSIVIEEGSSAARDDTITAGAVGTDFDVSRLWQAGSSQQRHAVHEHALVDVEGSAAAYRWATFVGRPDAERLETMSTLLSNWPYTTQRIVSRSCGMVAAFGAFLTGWALSRRMGANLVLDGIGKARLSTLGGFYSGITALILNERLVWLRVIDPAQPTCVPCVVATQNAASLFTGIALPALCSPWLAHFEAIRCTGIKPSSGSGFWGFFAVIWYLSLPVLRSQGLKYAGVNVAAGSATAAGQLWASRTVITTVQNDPDMLGLYGGSGTGQLGMSNWFGKAADSIRYQWGRLRNWLQR